VDVDNRKTITVRDDVYKRLYGLKLGNKSLCDVIDRLVPSKSLIRSLKNEVKLQMLCLRTCRKMYAGISLYLKMEDLYTNLKFFDELMNSLRGVILTKKEANKFQESYMSIKD